jgi:hypothetical protein
MEAGELRGAVAAFREARSTGPDPSASLLEGVCRYELGELQEARALLREAEAEPAHREPAELYLGLIALREGETGEAARLLASAARGPLVAPLARDLQWLTERTGKLVVSLLTESGWDSNAQLAPAQTPLAASSDGVFGIAGMALYRPGGEGGPYLRLDGLYRQQVRFTDLSYGGASASAGWQLGSRRRGLLAEYGYDYRALGGSGFLSAHRLLAGGWLPVRRTILGASYLARFESYPATLYAPFSGTYHRVEATASFDAGARTSVVLAYRAGVDSVRLAELSWKEHGPSAELRYRWSARLRAGVAAAVVFRGYDAVDPVLGLRRADTYLDAGTFLEWDVAPRWTLRASLDARDALSNAAGFAYVRVVPLVGFSYVVGL